MKQSYKEPDLVHSIMVIDGFESVNENNQRQTPSSSQILQPSKVHSRVSNHYNCQFNQKSYDVSSHLQNEQIEVYRQESYVHLDDFNKSQQYQQQENYNSKKLYKQESDVQLYEFYQLQGNNEKQQQNNYYKIDAQEQKKNDQETDVKETESNQQSHQSIVKKYLDVESYRQQRLEIKMKAFQSLKQWEEKNRHYLEQHQKIQDDVYQTLEKNCLDDIKSNEPLIDYFKKSMELMRQTIKFLLNPNQQLQQTFKIQGKFFYFKYHIIKEDDKKYNPQINYMIQEMLKNQYENGLVQQKIVQKIEQSVCFNMQLQLQIQKEKINELRNQYQQLQKKLQSNKKLIELRYQKYQKVFDEMIQNQGNHKNRKKDLFYLERKLIQVQIFLKDILNINQQEVENYVKQQMQIGQFIFGFFQEMMQLEQERHQQLENNFKLLSELDLFSQIANNKIKQQIAQIQIWQILTLQQQAIIMEQLQINSNDKLNEQQLQYFLSQLLLDQTKEKDLLNINKLIIHQQINVQQDVGELLQTWEQVSVIITIDFHMLIMINGKVTKKFPIENVKLQKQAIKPMIAQINHKIPGIIFDTNQTILLKFENQDDYEKLYKAFEQSYIDFKEIK